MAIYKTTNTGTGNGMPGMRETREMFTRIPGNVIILTFRGMFKRIPGNVPEHSRESWKRFREMFKRIPGNLRRDSGECS